MREDFLDAARQKTSQLAASIIKVVDRALEARGLVSENDTGQLVTAKWLREFKQTLEEEREKLHANEATLAVVGTVKSGKSTSINAIVGAEVVPSRDQPMTTFPTRVIHTPGVRIPTLQFPLVDQFFALARAIRERADLKSAKELDALLASQPQAETLKVMLADLMTGARPSLTRRAEGFEAVRRSLTTVNDLTRLARVLDIDASAFTSRELTFATTPSNSIEFQNLQSLENASQSTLALVDTPGPNEAGADAALHEIVRQQISHASAIVLIIDYGTLGTTATDDLIQMFEFLPEGQTERLFVFVNQYDRKGEVNLSEESTKSTVAKMLGKICKVDPLSLERRVFPVSSRFALLANQAARAVRNGEGINPKAGGWAEQFARQAGGSRWQKLDYSDPGLVQDLIESLQAEAGFEAPLQLAIAESAKNATGILVLSTLDKIIGNSAPLADMLGLRLAAFSAKAEDLDRLVNALLRDHAVLTEKAKDFDGSIEDAKWQLNEAMVKCVNTLNDGVRKTITKYLFEGEARQLVDHEINEGDLRAVSLKEIIGDVIFSFRKAMKLNRNSALKKSEEGTKLLVIETIHFDTRSKHPPARNGLIRFESESEARNTEKAIVDQIGSVLLAGVNSTEKTISNIINKYCAEAAEDVSKTFGGQWQLVSDRIEELLGVALTPPELQRMALSGDQKEWAPDALESETKHRTFWRKEETALGSAKRALGWFVNQFRTESVTWGMVERTESFKEFNVNVAKIESQAMSRVKLIEEHIKRAATVHLEETVKLLSDYGAQITQSVKSTREYLKAELEQRAPEKIEYRELKKLVAELSAAINQAIADARAEREQVM